MNEWKIFLGNDSCGGKHLFGYMRIPQIMFEIHFGQKKNGNGHIYKYSK